MDDSAYIIDEQTRPKQVGGVGTGATWGPHFPIGPEGWYSVATCNSQPHMKPGETLLSGQDFWWASEAYHSVGDGAGGGIAIDLSWPMELDADCDYEEDYDFGELMGVSVDRLHHMAVNTSASSSKTGGCEDFSGEGGDCHHEQSCHGLGGEGDGCCSGGITYRGEEFGGTEGSDAEDTNLNDNENMILDGQDNLVKDTQVMASRSSSDTKADLDQDPTEEWESDNIDFDEHQDTEASNQVVGSDKDRTKTDQDNEKHGVPNDDKPQDQDDDSGDDLDDDSDDDSSDDPDDDLDGDFDASSDDGSDNDSSDDDDAGDDSYVSTHQSRSYSLRKRKRQSKTDSPPWESVAAENPTSYVDDHGRRKSGRIKHLKRI